MDPNQLSSYLDLHCFQKRVQSFEKQLCKQRLIGFLGTWVKVFRIDPEFRILRLTFHRKSASKS